LPQCAEGGQSAALKGAEREELEALGGTRGKEKKALTRSRGFEGEREKGEETREARKISPRNCENQNILVHKGGLTLLVPGEGKKDLFGVLRGEGKRTYVCRKNAHGIAAGATKEKRERIAATQSGTKKRGVVVRGSSKQGGESGASFLGQGGGGGEKPVLLIGAMEAGHLLFR